jgi:oxygen-independent coproporphyrinogen-3 oxidase
MAHKPPAQAELERYIDTLVRECREKAAEARRLGGAVASVYIGGGTPTILCDELLEKLLNAVAECFLIGEGSLEGVSLFPEFTIEAGRPDTLTPQKLRIMRAYGANRIAVNAQTLNDSTLAAIGRGHSAADFFRGYEMARAAGFECINVDLIAALPGEGAEDLHRSIEGVLVLKPENITLHTFSLKRGSKLNEARALNRAAHETDGNFSSQMEIINHAAIFAKESYTPYYLYRQKHTSGLLENVGYALPGHECLYNVGMMSELHTVLGIGAAAVTKYVEGEKINRVFNEKNPDIYTARRASQ